jgi:hypothetical protein
MATPAIFPLLQILGLRPLQSPTSNAAMDFLRVYSLSVCGFGSEITKGFPKLPGHLL